MRTRYALLGCTMSLLVLASTGTSADRKSANGCTSIRVTSPDAPQPSNRSKKRVPTFSASSILDLKIEATLSPAVKEQHQLEFKVYTPKGHLYQSLPATMSAPASNGDRREGQKRTASAMLPVAGTTIVASSLYGQWKVEAFLNGGRDVACAPPFTFAIEP
jgi:hypothetical protein